MFTRLLAYPAILLGIWWALKPEALKNGLVWRTHWNLTWLALVSLFFPLFNFGMAAGVAVALLIFILFWTVMSRAGAAIREIFAKVPLVYFQAVGVLNIIGGVYILRVR